MDRQTAIEVYLSRNRRGESIIQKIMKWDETKSIGEIMKEIPFSSYPNAIMCARRYRITFIKKRKNHVNTNKESILKLLENGLKQSDIAHLLGVSRQRIEQIINIE